MINNKKQEQKFKKMIISVKCKNWRQNDIQSEESDAEFYNGPRQKALERDKYTCQCCGFRAEKWQEVHHVNDDHSDNRISNLLTVCMFCHLTQHIGLAGMNKEATLIWLPEISQPDLHHIVRAALYIKKQSEGGDMGGRSGFPMRGGGSDLKDAKEINQTAEKFFNILKSRAALAEEYFGFSDPSELANILLNMEDSQYNKREEFLSGLRLLPLGKRVVNGQDKMGEIIDSWSRDTFDAMKPSIWSGLFSSASSLIKDN